MMDAMRRIKSGCQTLSCPTPLIVFWCVRQSQTAGCKHTRTRHRVHALFGESERCAFTRSFARRALWSKESAKFEYTGTLSRPMERSKFRFNLALMQGRNAIRTNSYLGKKIRTPTHKFLCHSASSSFCLELVLF